MAVSLGTLRLWDSILELTKKSQDKGSDPMIWAIHLSSQLNSAGVSLPSPELANLLVSHICWDNNNPISWKFLEKALIFNIVPPLLVLALLSTRVIPMRHTQPAAFRLYMELLKRHAFKLKPHVEFKNYEVIMNSIDIVLNLSQIFGTKVNDPGSVLLEFIVAVVWQLVEAALGDEGLLELTKERTHKWNVPQDMEIEDSGSYGGKRIEILQSRNTVMAVELIGLFLQSKITSRILLLARRNMPTHWRSLVQDIEVLAVNSSALRSSKVMTPETLLQLISDDHKVVSEGKKANYLQEIHTIMSSSAGISHKVSGSSLWIPIDLALEDAMDGSQVDTTSAIEIITRHVKALQALHGTSWHECFLGLWMAALRLVQRERDPIEGPMPRLDTRLCMLLSITTLVVSDLIEDEESLSQNNINCQTTQTCKENRRMELVSSLQSLGDYQSLLTPPQAVIAAANQAAARAVMIISGNNVGSSAYFDLVNTKDIAAGNLHHLIVEACIARNLLDTSAYYWPGYVTGRINQIPHGVPAQVPGWSTFMKGAPLTPVMTNALVSEPASSLAELEKVFEIAVNGSDDDKIAAATILCGASLIRGWNVQEHSVYFITRLLSPPLPANYSGNDSHLIAYAPMLNVLLVGIAPIDCVQIFSLHGLVPHLAGSLMPICEVFGSCVPNISWTLTTGEEISAYAVFSNAFALLLKLWRFNHPPLEYGVGDVPPVGSQLTPEYLLLMRNSQLVSSGSLYEDRNRRRLSAVAKASCPNPMFVDSFPKLKAWYRQHQACLASTLSGLVHSPVHQIVDSLLNMMFRKINRNQPLNSVSGSSCSSGPGSDDTSLWPKLPAWDILEAVPFVVDAALTACAHGRLSPRELCTGLKDLADFLPASLAIIVSYFSAEVSRGVWKPVFMNGSDWPSPAANLSNVEEHIKNILAATNVNVPRLFAGISSPFTLPLPLAAFVSVTITYKLDKASQRFLDLAGPALESLAAGCPWPCMPIVASLWTQKAKKWSDFLVFSASRTVFLHDNDAVYQLLKSCFTATLGLNNSLVSTHGGVGALLGHGFGSNLYGEISPVAPGFLYLRVYRSIRDIMFLREDIISLLIQCVKDIASSGATTPKGKQETKYGQLSLATSLTKVKLAAQLAASILWISGGQGLVQSLINETLPSWFISAHREETGGPVSMLSGYALGYFTVLCGAFAWGVDSSTSASKWRPRFLGSHMDFLASALNGKITLGCDPITWHSYVTGFLNLMLGCMADWVVEVDVEVLKRLSKGLRQWNEDELALKLLESGGVGTMGAAAELIAQTDS
ncbi:putative mediator of RNA polymerase II transcription subunit 33A/B [Helianthus annuus]|uniref:Mediator of RNA polymerase II transcription subunit 33A/B n=1 Tax=Helianthus annuus TaxID=4232 RepID=A0A251TN04_HELAN|nr:mediator of RNA polymerase II transcription subunit 33A [Helianthus annuus]KAF5787780.1 putative mediator of RNA polymerase II transcription subunit 33A/B [Helianthus annuus]